MFRKFISFDPSCNLNEHFSLVILSASNCSFFLYFIFDIKVVTVYKYKTIISIFKIKIVYILHFHTKPVSQKATYAMYKRENSSVNLFLSNIFLARFYEPNTWTNRLPNYFLNIFVSIACFCHTLLECQASRTTMSRDVIIAGICFHFSWTASLLFLIMT